MRWSLLLATVGGWPRRVLAACLLLAAGLAWLRGPAPATAGAAEPRRDGVTVLTAARDLPAGTALARADLQPANLPADLVPAGAVRPPGGALGRIVAGAVRRGEPLTDARLVGPGLAVGLSPAESTAVPVRLADGQTAALVRAGDRVDILSTPADPGPGPTSAAPATGVEAAGTTDGSGRASAQPAAAGDATVVAAGVRVLAVLGGSEAAPTDGALIVVAASTQLARRLVGASTLGRLSVTLRPP